MGWFALGIGTHTTKPYNATTQRETGRNPKLNKANVEILEAYSMEKMLKTLPTIKGIAHDLTSQ